MGDVAFSATFCQDEEENNYCTPSTRAPGDLLSLLLFKFQAEGRRKTCMSPSSRRVILLFSHSRALCSAMQSTTMACWAETSSTGKTSTNRIAVLALRGLHLPTCLHHHLCAVRARCLPPHTAPTPTLCRMARAPTCARWRTAFCVSVPAHSVYLAARVFSVCVMLILTPLCCSSLRRSFMHGLLLCHTIFMPKRAWHAWAFKRR